MELWYSVLSVLPFEWAQPGQMYFMKHALLAVLVISPLFGILSTMVVHSKMSFFSDALGHSAFTGMAIGALCVDLAHGYCVASQQFHRRGRVFRPQPQAVAAALFLHPPGRPQQAAANPGSGQYFFAPLGEGHRAKGNIIKFHTAKPPGTIYVREVEFVQFSYLSFAGKSQNGLLMYILRKLNIITCNFQNSTIIMIGLKYKIVD